MIDIHSVEHNNEIYDLIVPKQAFLTKLRHFQNLAKYNTKYMNTPQKIR